MSVEEDTELKNLVAQTLENKGILPKIRAELRANVFLALEENPTTKETLLSNDELSAFVKIPIGALILNLIREFLEFFELEFTLSVFDPETKYGKEYNSIARDKMMKELKITDCKKKNPLLYDVIERVINNDEFRTLQSEKGMGDVSLGDVSGSGDSGRLFPSPTGLNSTYVKNNSDVDSLPVSPIVKDGKDEEESIKEELISNNVSESDSLGESKSNQVVAPAEAEVISNESLKESKSNAQSQVYKDPIEIDLLIFTPVKETKSKEKIKNETLPNGDETKTSERKENPKSMSVLGDLPPLTSKHEEKGAKINEIKAIIDKWSDFENEEELSIGSKSSKEQIYDNNVLTPLKSDRSDVQQNLSQKSDKTETADDFEEDISDLINGHTSSDNQLTVDETISKASCAADYLESL